ncbi:hypothetical protein D3C78_831370 [compost metagenome]
MAKAGTQFGLLGVIRRVSGLAAISAGASTTSEPLSVKFGLQFDATPLTLHCRALLAAGVAVMSRVTVPVPRNFSATWPPLKATTLLGTQLLGVSVALMLPSYRRSQLAFAHALRITSIGRQLSPLAACSKR